MNMTPKSHHSIFSLICPFQEPLMLSTTHWMLLIPLCQTKPSTFEMIFPLHLDIALDQLVFHQCCRSVLSILSPKDFQNLPMLRDQSSRTSSVRALSISPSQPLTFWWGVASTKENDKLIHGWLHEWAKWSGSLLCSDGLDRPILSA